MNAWPIRMQWKMKLMMVHTATATSPLSGACSSANTIRMRRLGLRRAVISRNQESIGRQVWISIP